MTKITFFAINKNYNLYLSFSRKKKIQYIQKKGEKLKTEIEIRTSHPFLFRYRKRSLSQQAEVSLITRPMYYKGSFLPRVLSSAVTRQLMIIKQLNLRKGWCNPYVAMGLHIPHPLAQLVGFLWSSGSRLVWNRLQLATIDVVKQRSEDFPCSLRPTKNKTHCQNK
jgi:hypothetical protein